MTSILFVCTDNAVRAPMAEACLRALSCGAFEAYSAGIAPTGLHPLTRVVLTEAGISARELHSKTLSASPEQHWDYVISLCADAAEHPALIEATIGARRLHWDIADPTEAPGFAARLRAFRDTRNLIRRRVEGFVASMNTAVPEPLSV